MDMKLDILNILDKSCEVADINKIARMHGKTEAEVADVINFAFAILNFLL